MLQFTDRAPLSQTRRTSDGYLTTVARSVRTGVQLYAGSEVGRPDLATVNVYRPASEVHSKDSLQSFSHAPVTINHPSVAVTADNWKELAVGEVSTAAQVDSEGWVSLPLVLKDSAAIAAVESGKRELSAGYTCELVWGDGVAPDGTAYQATQTNIRINHLAVVDAARAGHEARIGDNWGVSPIPQPEQESRTMSDRTVLVDGLQVVTNDAGAQAIAKLMADAATARTAHDAAIAAKDADIATLDATLATTEAKLDAALANVLDAAALDARVAARGDLVARVKALAPAVVADGKSDLDVKRAVLVARKVVIDGKSDAYIEARFDTLVEDHAGADKTAADLADKTIPVSDADAEAKALATANDHNAWRAA